MARVFQRTVGDGSVSTGSLCFYEDLVGTLGLLGDSARDEQCISVGKTLGREYRQVGRVSLPGYSP